ncbi:MAG: glycosyl transferase family 90 [Chlamydiota bacterium]
MKTPKKYALLACITLSSLSLIPLIKNRSQHRQAIVAKDAKPIDWMDSIIIRQFSRFENSGITRKMIDKTWDKCHSKCSWFKRYKIIDSKVYGETSNVKFLLEKMVEQYQVPDVDFIYYNHDKISKPLYNSLAKHKIAPIFVSAKEVDMDRLILFVDWYYNIKETKNFGWNSLIQRIDKAQCQWPWENKIEKAFWRGSPTDGLYNWKTLKNYPRGRLVYESKKNAEFFDASFVNYPSWQVSDINSFVENLGKATFIHPDEQIKFKYQIDLDGVTCSYPGTQWKLISGCLLIKQQTKDVMWFYEKLVPWKHYVPLDADLKNLTERIQWAKEHDSEARKIAMQAREFAKNHLMPEHILLFCYKALLKYASLQTFKPSLTKKEKSTKSPSCA